MSCFTHVVLEGYSGKEVLAALNIIRKVWLRGTYHGGTASELEIYRAIACSYSADVMML